MSEKIYRRDFLQRLGKWGLALSGASLVRDFTYPAKVLARLSQPLPILGIAELGEPQALTRKAVELLGGMSKFVKKGEKVFIKPNISFERILEQAANVNPEVLKAVILMCLESGASTVRIADRSANNEKVSYAMSGAVDVVKSINDKRVELFHMESKDFQVVKIPRGKYLKSWPIHRYVFEMDKFINIPIGKHHAATGLTLGMKNIMGVMGGKRSDIHLNLHQSLADLNTVIKPDLIVMDCFRILIANGPTGGSLHDVANPKVVIAGADPVAVDSYTTTLFGRKGEEIGYIKLASEFGLGEIDLKKIDLRKAVL